MVACPVRVLTEPEELKELTEELGREPFSHFCLKKLWHSWVSPQFKLVD